jgi:hypothetical protein
MVFDMGLKLLEAKIAENANIEQFLGQSNQALVLEYFFSIFFWYNIV